MAGITLAQAEAQLASWLTADTAVSQGQAYTIGMRSLTRADAEEIRKNIQFWDSKTKDLARSVGGGIRVRGITPV